MRDKRTPRAGKGKKGNQGTRGDTADANQRRESGAPGGGQGRRDDVGSSGVHPLSAGIDPNRNAELRTMAASGAHIAHAGGRRLP